MRSIDLVARRAQKRGSGGGHSRFQTQLGFPPGTADGSAAAGQLQPPKRASDSSRAPNCHRRYMPRACSYDTCCDSRVCRFLAENASTDASRAYSELIGATSRLSFVRDRATHSVAVSRSVRRPSLSRKSCIRDRRARWVRTQGRTAPLCSPPPPPPPSPLLPARPVYWKIPL
jgi:hypothetical protein